MKKKEDNEEIMVRLILKSNDDKEIYNFFKKIKEYLGVKVNTEVTRYCIRRAYEILFGNNEKEKEINKL